MSDHACVITPIECTRRIPLHDTPYLHAAMTSILGRGHRPHERGVAAPDWSLVPWPSSSSWAAAWWSPDDADAVTRTEHDVRIGRIPSRLRFGHRTRVRWPPVPARCDHTITVASATPIIVHDGHGSTEAIPTDSGMRSALCGLARKIGARTDGVDVSVLDARVRRVRVQLAGKHGAVVGWHGAVTMRATPAARWLAELAARGLGIGGRTSMGLGAVRVIV